MARFFTKESALIAVNQYGNNLGDASEELRNNKEVVLAAVIQDGFALQFASDELKNDRELVLIAIKNSYSDAIWFASRELRKNRDFILSAMKLINFPLCITNAADPELRNDKDVILTAVKQNGRALEYASLELRNDKEIVLAAVKQTGWVLQYASDELKNNKEIVLAAIEHDIDNIQYASAELQKIWNENGSFMDKKYLVCENNTSCLISMSEIKEGDSYYKCSNEKIEQGHYYLKESFDEWRKLGKSNKCVYCFSNIINIIFVNSNN